ncbi:MAG: molybdopterin-dependent oxidoreductase [Ktedonobacteraceae bacterium]|nr:molybdopterin-dependent oxidoreductase [Ktedonobacteraceae bacterium]
MELELSINGVIESLDIAPGESLLTLLRREGYRSVKQGCETGECGACTVLVDGVPRPSCVMLAAQAGGCALSTVESLGSARRLHPLQQAFIDVGAVQCGFCTPGMLLSASVLLKNNLNPTESEARDAISGNLCRCTGYEKPVQAIMRAAAILRGETVVPLEPTVTNAADKNGTSQQQYAASANGGTGATAVLPIMSTSATAAMTLSALHTENKLQVVGTSVPAIDAVKLVSGKAAFVADSSPRGMLYGRILTSPHAHAVIRDIDVSQAKALPGVHVVLTYKDVKRVPYSRGERSPSATGPLDQYMLDNIMRYVGDRVAVVAAETLEVAEQALALITVDYDVQPAILDPRKSFESNAPCLHPEKESDGIFDAKRNIAARIRTEVGDVEAAFAIADSVIEGEYVVPIQHPAPLENHSVITYFDEDGSLVVRTGSQVPHYIRRTLASLLNIPARSIRIVRPDVGGDFGTKQELVLEDLCALLTLATERPVMLAYSRAEEMCHISQHHIVRLKTGVKRDGTITANQMVLLTSTGAYATHPLIAEGRGSFGALALYPCSNMRFAAEILYTSTPPSAALRGHGSPAEFFALENHIDEIARQVGIDVLALRRKNWIRAGDAYPLQKTAPIGREAPVLIESCGLPACLQKVEERLRWREMRGKVSNGRTRRGVGIGLAVHGSPLSESNGEVGTAGAIIKLNVEGSFDVFTAANEGGNVSATLLVQVAAEVLGVSVEDILMHTSDSTTLPFEAGANGSSTLYMDAGAVQKAAEQVRRQILGVAGRMLNALPESLKISSGVITASGGQKVTIAQVAEHALYKENRQIMTTASWKGQRVPLSFAAQGVEVEVDMETGEVRILKAITAVDAGKIINPLLIEGQVEGSAAQGLGSALVEELLYDQQGKPLTNNLSEYGMHTASDMPVMQTYLMETAALSSPFGMKVVAEIPLQGMGAALANAVADAIGVRIRQLPLTPERVLRAIHAQAAKK